MPHPDRVVVAHDSPLSVHVIVRSKDTGLLYKLWTRSFPGGEWTVAGDGISDDDAADRFDLGVVRAGSSFAYWFAIGGEEGAGYHVDLAFLQDGRIVAGGLCKETGRIGEDELAIVESRVVFP